MRRTIRSLKVESLSKTAEEIVGQFGGFGNVCFLLRQFVSDKTWMFALLDNLLGVHDSFKLKPMGT